MFLILKLDEMEEAKNRIDGGDVDVVKKVLNNLIDRIQQDISTVNNSMSTSLSATLANQTATNNTMLNNTALNNTTTPLTPSNTTASNTSISNTAISNTKNETSILGLLYDIFSEKEEKNPIETISKLNILSRSLKDVSATLSSKCVCVNRIKNNF